MPVCHLYIYSSTKLLNGRHENLILLFCKLISLKMVYVLIVQDTSKLGNICLNFPLTKTVEME